RQQLEQALPTAAGDTVLSSLLDQRSIVERQIVQLHSKQGSTADLDKQLGDLNQKISNRVDGVMLSLNEGVDSSKQSLDQITAEVEVAKKQDLALATQARPYFEAKQKLEELKRFDQILQMKYATESIDGSLPKTTMVEIMDDARPATNATQSLWG